MVGALLLVETVRIHFSSHSESESIFLTEKIIKLLEIKLPMIPLGTNNAASFPKRIDAFFSKTIFAKKKKKQIRNTITNCLKPLEIIKLFLIMKRTYVNI